VNVHNWSEYNEFKILKESNILLLNTFMSNSFLKRLALDDEPLLTLIFENVDDSMLTVISRADFGYEADTHLKALHQIKAGNIPIPMPWNPGLVLGLVQWAEPDDPTRSDVRRGTAGHWMRLFACAVLIRASIELENYDYQTEDFAYLDEDYTVVQFLESALHLGHDASLAALRFLGWRMQYQIERLPINEDIGNGTFYAVATLLLCVSLGQCDPETINFLISVAHFDNEYLPISKVIAESMESQKWKNIICSLLLKSTKSSACVHPDLQTFGTTLIGGYI
jgi:hypothetical protein